jgi:DNA-binding winged helix-turn-helix (wHTH) protein/WD40 repeat protein
MEPTGNGRHRLRFGVFEVDLAARELSRRGTPLRLQEKPFQILAVLLEHPGEIVTREELQRRLWPDGTFVDFEKGLNTAITKLRTALSDSAENPRFVETIPRRGYRFIAPVNRDSDGNGNGVGQVAESSSAANSAVADSVIASQPGSSPTSERRTRALTFSAVILLLAVAGFALYRWKFKSELFDRQGLHLTQTTTGLFVTNVTISPDGRYVVYAHRENEGESLWLRQIATGSSVRILPPGPGFHGLTFSPDGNYIYLVRSDENDPYFKYLYSMAILGGTVRKLITDVDSPVSFSPDGKHFVYEHCLSPGNDIELKIVNADGTAERVLAVLHEGSNFLFQPGPSWSPDGEQIAVPVRLVGKQFRWVLDLVSAMDGKVKELFSSPDDIGRPAWHSGSVIVPLVDPQLRRTQIWSISSTNGEAHSFTKDQANYGLDFDTTRDGRTAVARVNRTLSHIWTAPATDLSQAQQITSDELPMLTVAEASDGKLLTGGGDWRSVEGKTAGIGELWMMNADGSQRSRFADARNVGWVVPCGRYVVFTVNEINTVGLMRVDRDGTHRLKLASGNIWGLACSADGESVFYASIEQPHKIWNIPTTGGAPTAVADVTGDLIIGRLAVAPDGKFLAYLYTQFGHVPSAGWNMAVLPVHSGPPVRTIRVEGGAGILHWSPDGRSLQYVVTRGGVSNLREQPLSGAKPRRLTNFASDEIYDFNWTADHKRLLLTRGHSTSDVVLLDLR